MYFFNHYFQSVIAQQDSINRKNDSINAAILSDYNKKIAAIEEQRKEDSTKRAELQVQLNSLKTTDNLKKQELQQQLQNINDRDSARTAQKKAQIDSLRQTAKGYPVIGFFKDTLFLIYNRSGSFTAEDRAEALSQRIHRLAADLNFKPDSLLVISSETTADIDFRDRTIMSVSENDALWNNASREELAKKYQANH